MKIKFDCRNYLGEKPCRFKRLCEECPHYEGMGERILVIKLGALGDVLRTTPILHGLARKYRNPFIIWLTDPSALPLLEDCPLIDRLYPYELPSLVRLGAEEFDLALNFDKEPRATALIMQVKATEKLGFGMGTHGNLISLNPEADYSLLLGLSDELKFRRNTKTYQELCFESARLDYQSDEYIFSVPDEVKARMKELLNSLGGADSERVVGLNIGAGTVFPTKRWLPEYFAELADLISTLPSTTPLLLAGPQEEEIEQRVLELSSAPMINPGNELPIKDFAGLISNCSLVVTGDTLAMHLAIAQKVPVVALFGSTCHQEVELYGRGEKIISEAGCAPCYRSSCETMLCMRRITPEMVFDAVRRQLHL